MEKTTPEKTTLKKPSVITLIIPFPINPFVQSQGHLPKN